ncbi:MAG: hypothetical protein ACRDG4_10205 [Chloroflexota bacterium]
MALEDLRRILTPPTKPADTGSPTAWAAAESALGISYPPDFKKYIATYGSGTLSGVISVFNPISIDWTDAPTFAALPTSLDALLGCLGPHGNAQDVWLYGLASTLAVCEGFDSVVLPGSDGSVPVRLWPELPGLFPWARGDAGQALLWWVDGTPESRPVVLADPSEGLIAYPMTMAGFLAGWLDGSLRPAYLPPAGRPRFRREAT